MSTKDNFQERRKHKRFEVKSGAFAVSPSSFYKLGQIKNISKGGLAFWYAGNAEITKDPYELEILSIVDDFYLRKLPVKIVLDVELDNQVSFSAFPLRQVNLEFGKLNYHQKVLLGHFLEKHTHK